MTPNPTLSLLQFIENNGLGEIDKDLFWQKLGTGMDGIYIADMGSTQERGMRPSFGYEFYSRANDDLRAYETLNRVRELMLKSYANCILPAVPEYTEYKLVGVTIMPPSSISNAGYDADGHIIYSFNGTIYYNGIERDVGEESEPILTEMNKSLLTENLIKIETE